MVSMLALLCACGPSRPEPVDEAGASLALSVNVPFAELEVGGDGAVEADRVRGSVHGEHATRLGLLLPPPSRVAWDVEIPPAAELHFAAGLVSDDEDGAGSAYSLAVEIEAEGQVEELWSRRVEDDRFAPVRIDLSAWSGRRVRLRMRTAWLPAATPFPWTRRRTSPRDAPERARALVADPVVASRKARPRRVVILFVDTLRADHLGLYGYGGDTSPALDAFAEGAVVFEQARSVAPWTLPSARSLVTGRSPEAYLRAATLPGRLRAEGFATAMFSSNFYLARRFHMQRDWGLHRNAERASAEQQAQRALGWLADQDGRDVLLLVHFMDPHLPYREPLRYRDWRPALDPPIADGKLFRRPLARLPTPVPEELRDYLRGRYDNNVRYVDAALGRIFASLHREDVVVVLSDHGEEFWDHGAFEHGHSLHDELLHVPLVLRAPGLAPVRVREPVSLVDVMPTLLEILGLDATGLDGMSLLAAARGDADSRRVLARRTLAFGRPLYGRERWGVLRGEEKIVSDDGAVESFDLVADPGEEAARVESALEPLGERFRAMLAGSLGREVVAGFQLAASEPDRTPHEVLHATLHVPGGVEEAWVREDPRRRARVSLELDAARERVEVTWARARGGGEVFVVPRRPPVSVAGELELDVERGERVTHHRAATSAGDLPAPLLDLPVAGDRRLLLTLALVPRPRADDEPLVADDEALRSRLRALGYEVGPDPDELPRSPAP
jgi:arylsulfatase A-like enzyme